MAKVAALVFAHGLTACSVSGHHDFVGADWTLEELRYSARVLDPFACADSLSDIAAHRQAFAEFFTLSKLSRAPLHYYKYQDSSDLLGQAGCPPEADACFDGSVRSSLPVDYHELTHAWVRAGFDVSTQFASEGIATALSCMPFSGGSEAGGPLSLALGSGSSLNYHAAARLVMQLLALGSPQALVDWTEQVDAAKDDHPAAAAIAAQRIYGQSLEQIWSEASQTTSLSCFALGRCDAPLLPFAKIRLNTGCTSTVHFLISKDLGPAIGVSSVGARPDILPCSPEANAYAPRNAGITDPANAPDAESILETPALPHLLTLADRDATLEALVTARALPGAFDRTCSLAAPVRLIAKETRIILPERADTLYFPLQVASGVLSTLLVGSDVSGVSLAWCERCDACLPLTSDLIRSASGSGALRVALDPATTPRILLLKL